MPAPFLNGVRRSIKTMPMLKTCTPPPDMYSITACIGSCLTGLMARSQARFLRRASYDEGSAAAAAPADLLLGFTTKIKDRRTDTGCSQTHRRRRSESWRRRELPSEEQSSQKNVFQPKATTPTLKALRLSWAWRVREVTMFPRQESTKNGRTSITGPAQTQTRQ